jgi:DNA-binding protein HU-beta
VFLIRSVFDEKREIMGTETTEIVGKQELVKRIADATNVTQKQVGEIFDATLTAIKEALQDGSEVRLIGFGTFAVRESAERPGVNPRTREPMMIPAKERVRFSAGKDLSEAVQS